MNKKRQTIQYIICDFITAAIVWTLFFFIRNNFIDAYYLIYPELRNHILTDTHYIYGLCFIPAMWIALYYLSGYYKNIYRKSRLKEFLSTFFITIFGTTILFFTIILDDNVPTYKAYYQSYLLLVLLHFVITYIPRFIITTTTIRKIRSRKLGFNTLLVGSNEKADSFFKKRKYGSCQCRRKRSDLPASK